MAPARGSALRSTALAALAALALLALAGCSYSYRNPVEALAPGEVGGRTVAGSEVLIDGVAISVRGAALDGLSRSNGRFSMLPLPVGHHTLMFRKGLERALQREVDIGYGQDGQVQGIWLGDVAIPASVGLTGGCAPPEGHWLAENGVAVDEVSGAAVPVSAGSPGAFTFEGLAVGQHRIRVYATDQVGVEYVGGPANVEFLVSDAGTRKTLARIPMHRVAKAPPVPATVRITLGVSGSLPGLKLSDLEITGLPSKPVVGSDGSSQVEVPEGLWTLGVKLPASLTSVTPPPPVTFVALAGMTVDLGTLYAVTDPAQSLASRGCRADADCAPGTCTASHVCDAGYQPPQQAPASTPFCDLDWRGCTAGQPLGGVWNDTTSSYDPPVTLTCVQAGAVTVGVVCGSCCSPDGVTTACAPLDGGGCARAAGPPPPPRFTLSGTVSGAVVTGVNLTLSGSASGATATDSTGAFGFTGVGAGSYTVTPSLAGYTFTPASLPVTVSGFDVTGINFNSSVAGGGSGGTWVAQASPTTQHLGAVWGSSPSDAWSVGTGGTILRWNGSSWASVISPTTADLQGIWGSATDNVWAVGGTAGSPGVVLHWDGTAWSAVPNAAGNILYGVWGSWANDVWAVGWGGVEHWDGNAWTGMASGTGSYLLGVGGTAVDDAWAVAGNGTIVHWDGTAWTSVSNAMSGLGFSVWGIWGSSFNDVWAGAYSKGGIQHWDGTAWTSLSATAPNAIWGASPSDVYSVAMQGAIQHWDGSAWSSMPNPVNGTATNLWSTWGTGAGDVWAVGDGGTILHLFSSATAATHAISGTVVSSATGVALGGVTMTLSGSSRATATSSATGAYHFAALADGIYTVTPSLAGYTFTPALLPVTVSGGDVPLQDFTATIARSSFSISGTISGAIVDGVQVWITSGADTGTNSDATGAWTITGLSNGTYSFSPSSPGYTFIPASITVTVNGADALLLDFVATTNIGQGYLLWENPLPQGNQLNGTWSAASNDVWAVGAAGTVLRWNGTAWSSVWGGTTQELTAVWGTSASDIWAVGAVGTILHWNGFNWSSFASGTTNRLEAVWGISTTDAWAVGAAGTILHWNGAAWTTQPSGTSNHLYGVWGSAATDVWAVGDDGGGFSLTVRWNGSTWTTGSAGTSALSGIWGSAANDVWAVGRAGSTSHWNGTAWLAAQISSNDLEAVWGASGSDVWATGNGEAWRWTAATGWRTSALPVPSWNFAVGGSAANDLWVVGKGGATYHFDGSTWTRQTNAIWINELTGVWSSSTTDVWAVGHPGIYHSTGAGWSFVTSPSNFVHSAVWGSSPSDVWVTGWFATFVIHWNGAAWSMVTTPRTGYLFSVWGSSANDVWAVGSAGSILHWDGSSWTTSTSGTVASLNGVWSGSATDAWAVGGGGTILRWNGSSWSSVTAPSALFNSVWGAGPNDVWAVGADASGVSGTVVHWDGTAWSSVPVGTTSVLRGVWGTASQDVWAVGDLGTVLHWDGVAWSTVPGITANSLYAAWGLPGAGLWAVGQDNAVVRYRP
jgi:hypothetical protein